MPRAGGNGLARRAQNDRRRFAALRSFQCHVAAFAEIVGCGGQKAGPSLPNALASDGPPAARAVGCTTSDLPPPFSSATHSMERIWIGGHYALPPATRQSCAAATRSPEHRLAERR